MRNISWVSLGYLMLVTIVLPGIVVLANLPLMIQRPTSPVPIHEMASGQTSRQTTHNSCATPAPQGSDVRVDGPVQKKGKEP